MNAVQCENNVVLKIKLEQDNLLRLHVSEYVAKLKPSDVIILNYFDIDKNNYQTINCKIGWFMKKSCLTTDQLLIVMSAMSKTIKKQKMKTILLELNMMMQL